MSHSIHFNTCVTGFSDMASHLYSDLWPEQRSWWESCWGNCISNNKSMLTDATIKSHHQFWLFILVCCVCCHIMIIDPWSLTPEFRAYADYVIWCFRKNGEKRGNESCYCIKIVCVNGRQNIWDLHFILFSHAWCMNLCNQIFPKAHTRFAL